MEVFSQLVQNVFIPRMAHVYQRMERPVIKNIPEVLRVEIGRTEIAESIKPGMRIAISCGSRGVANIALVIRELVNICKGRGAKPFIFPAMGSHGGATAVGQLETLTSLGVTEEYCGCPVISSMETVNPCKTKSGIPIFIDKAAWHADGIIVVGRIKAHTAFRGQYESGLMKMIAIGLGKRDSAEACHVTGFRLMHKIIPEVACTTLQLNHILFGIGLIENSYDETCIIKALTPAEIPCEEPGLLERSKQLMARIYLTETDLLIVDRIGKNISGDGADPNITGNFCCPYASGGLKAQRRVVLDLTDETQGNAMGVGMYDATTRRLFQKIDFNKTYTNPIISTAINMARIPIIMDSDHDAIAVCLKTSTEIDIQNPRIIRISDSLHIGEIYVSEAHLEEVRCHPKMEIIGGPQPFPFDENGNLW